MTPRPAPMLFLKQRRFAPTNTCRTNQSYLPDRTEYAPGGGKLLADIAPAQDLWFRAYVYFPADFPLGSNGCVNGAGCGGAHIWRYYEHRMGPIPAMQFDFTIPAGMETIQLAMFSSGRSPDATAEIGLNTTYNPVAGHGDSWQCWETRIKLNTLGQSDGIVEFWVDGKLIMKRTGLNQRGSTDLTYKNIDVQSNIGTGNPVTQPTMTNMWWLIDDVVVSTTRVGPIGGIGDTVVPVAPTNLTATAKSLSQIDLSWKNNSTNATGFEIEKKVSPTGVWTLAGSVPANQTNYSVTGLGANHTFYFQVRAVNSSNIPSVYTNEASATTSASAIIAEEMGLQGRPNRSPVLEIHGGNVRFTLPGSGAYQLSVYDLAGSLVWQKSGSNSLQLNAHNSQLFNNGVYMARAMVNGEHFSERFVVVK